MTEPVTSRDTHSSTVETDGGWASRVRVAVDCVRSRCEHSPRLGVILGTGLGDLVADIDSPTVLSYADIPHFRQSTALGHKGRFVLGMMGIVPVIVMDGRCHFYEGHSFDEVVMGVRVMQKLGVHTLVVTNASGGLNPKLASGDILVLDGHFHLMGRRLTSAAVQRRGDLLDRLPKPYCPELAESALRVARSNGFFAIQGTYAALLGPNYETRAEYRMLRRLGADVVGMSTVPEAVAAAEVGTRVLALSVVTNVAKPDTLGITAAQDVVDRAAEASMKVRHIVRDVAMKLE